MINFVWLKEKKAEDGGTKTSFEDSAFESLEKDFQEVLNELMGDKSLEKFRTEYEKLHRALKKSHDSEKRLMQKCRELNAEIVANSAKVATALKLSTEDQTTIAQLKKVRINLKTAFCVILTMAKNIETYPFIIT